MYNCLLYQSEAFCRCCPHIAIASACAAWFSHAFPCIAFMFMPRDCKMLTDQSIQQWVYLHGMRNHEELKISRDWERYESYPLTNSRQPRDQLKYLPFLSTTTPCYLGMVNFKAWYSLSANICRRNKHLRSCQTFNMKRKCQQNEAMQF